jgi:DNA-binding NarL/FixJ family response regulator
MIKVVIADSNQLVRAGLNVIFRNYDHIQVIGEAHCDQDLESLVVSYLPDISIIDFAARGFSIDVIQRCHKLHPKLRFVAITGEQNGITIVNALRAGIQSYIKKDCAIHEIVDSIAETHRGSRFFCGQILDTIRREEIDVNDLDLLEAACEPVTISEREQEVIKLIAEGYTNNEIASKLFLSPHTVNTHRKNIMAKLGVNNTAAIVMYAVKTKLVSPNKFLFSPLSVG